MLANVFTKTLRDRWRGMAIAAVTLGLTLLFGMAVYRDIDLAVYTDLPEVFRSLMNIPQGADAASLAYGAIYGSYGALTLAALALAMGSASIAGEERKGTIGLLLGNPVSRIGVQVSKAASLLVLTAAGALGMWGAGVLSPVLLDVNVTGMRVGALVFHMFVNALFYGFLAMAIGAWTGRTGLASGATVAVMLVSFVAAGLFPIVEGLESAAKAFPWYYFDGSEPVNNGISWGHAAVLLGGGAACFAAAVAGVRSRDLRDQNAGVTLLDRLREHPATKRAADRLAGSTRVSRVWVKAVSDHQGMLFVTAAVMFGMMGVMMGPLYSLLDESVLDFADQIPETMLALFGGGDLATPEGFYQVETFGLMAPIAVMVVTVAVAARGLAGEEARRTMGLLLANPITRRAIVLEKALAMTVVAALVGIATFAGVALGSMLGGLDIRVANIAAVSLLVTLLGLAIGALALALSAATGRVKVAVFGTIGIALPLYVANALLPLSDRLAGWARWTPFHYYLGGDPLVAGLRWGDAAILAALAAALVALAVMLFERRDLRQTD